MRILQLIVFYLFGAATIVGLDWLIRNFLLSVNDNHLMLLHAILIAFGVSLQVMITNLSKNAADYIGMATMVVLMIKMIVVVGFLFVQRNAVDMQPIDWIYRIGIYFLHTAAMVFWVIRQLTLQK